MRASDKSVFRVMGPPDLPAPPHEVIDVLAPLVTPERRARIEAVVGRRTLNVVPVLDNIADPHNASAIMRTCDALGVQRVAVIANERPFLGSHKVAKGTERWLDLVRYDTPADCGAALHEQGYQIFVASMEGDLTPEDLAKRPRVAVVFGNEHRGPSEELRAVADGTFAVPMVGFVESLNVSVAAAMTLYALTRDVERRVSEKERIELVARYLMSTVRSSEAILRETFAARDEAR